MDDNGRTAAYNEGHKDGYRKGETERVALATANSELRSTILRLEQMIGQRMYAPTQEYVPHHQEFFDGDHRVDL